MVVLWVFALRVVSLELESTHLLVVYHTLFPSLIKELYLDSRVKELCFKPFMFMHSQPLAPFPVAHFGLGVFSTCSYMYHTPAQGCAWHLQSGSRSSAVCTRKEIEL